MRLRVVELYDRGLKSFDSLSPLEKDVFVVNDLDIYYEMEGDFADYLLGGGHEAELAWLAATLERIQDAESAALLAELRGMGEADRPAMTPLCKRYYSVRNQRWTRLEEYLRRHGVELDE